MSMPIPPYVPSFKPVPQVTPFTYRDGITMLKKLDDMVKYLNRVIVPFVNTDLTELGDKVESDINNMIEQVNAAIDEVLNSSVQVQDAVVAGIFQNPASATRAVTDALYASKAALDALTATVGTNTTNITALQTGLSQEIANRIADVNAEETARIAAINQEVSDRNAAIAAEATARTNGLATKRDIAAATPASNVDFNTLTATGTYYFSTPPTHASAPVSAVGILEVEASGTTITHRYYTDTAEYRRTSIAGVFNMWFKQRLDFSYKPWGKITFIGDSYMVGLNLTNPTTQRWPRLYCDTIGATEVNLANSGSGYVNAGASGNFVTQSGSVPTDTTTVIICGGINDAPLHPSQSDIQTAVNSIVANIRANAPRAKIIFISPMWFQNNVSADLLTMDDRVRTAVATVRGVQYIENAMWLRVDRTDLAQGDGHPNLAGSQVIAAWVNNNINKPTDGNIQGRFVSPMTGDVVLPGPSAQLIADGTIPDARPGWYTITGQIVAYTATLGFLQLRAGAFIEETRNDVQSVNPEIKQMTFDYYHAGGDLYIGIAYRPNGSSSVSITGLNKNRVTADWIRN